MLFGLLLFVILVEIWARFTEDERVAYWKAHHTWPPQWQPETEGYRELMEEREREIMQLTGADERWENWMQYVTARLVPNFTELGFKIIQTPEHIQAKLHRAVMDGVAQWDDLPFELGVEDSIYADEPPKFVHLRGLDREVLQELQALHEDWAGGIKLKPSSAYGVRLYQNGSTIVMHNDKVRYLPLCGFRVCNDDFARRQRHTSSPR